MMEFLKYLFKIYLLQYSFQIQCTIEYTITIFNILVIVK